MRTIPVLPRLPPKLVTLTLTHPRTLKPTATEAGDVGAMAVTGSGGRRVTVKVTATYRRIATVVA